VKLGEETLENGEKDRGVCLAGISWKEIVHSFRNGSTGPSLAAGELPGVDAEKERSYSRSSQKSYLGIKKRGPKEARRDWAAMYDFF